jgi:hypothetical protein
MKTITFQDILSSFDMTSITEINKVLNIWQIILNLVVACVIMLFIYWIYKKTFTGVLYSKNFNITLILVSLVATAVVMVISSNLVLALGMVGALSIVRFRMAIKDPKDVGFLFWAITNGIICGISAYYLAAISALFIGIVVFIVSKKITIREPYLLILNMKSIDTSEVEEILEKHTDIFKLRSKIITDEKTENIIEIKIRKTKIKPFLADLKEIQNIEFIKLVSYQGDLEEG